MNVNLWQSLSLPSCSFTLLFVSFCPQSHLYTFRYFKWRERVYSDINISLGAQEELSKSICWLFPLSVCNFLPVYLSSSASAPLNPQRHPPIENSKSGGLGLYAAWPHCCYQLQRGDQKWCHPSLSSSSTVCKTTPVYMCVGVFPVLCVCVHVRAFMHQPGNCRCWFVCIQGSACSRSQESFLKVISSCKVSSLNPLSSAQTLSLKTLIFNFISLRIFFKKSSSVHFYIYVSTIWKWPSGPI